MFHASGAGIYHNAWEYQRPRTDFRHRTRHNMWLILGPVVVWTVSMILEVVVFLRVYSSILL